MDMFYMDLTSIIFRWVHVVAGIMWIGFLYWFNFVNIPFQGTIDGDTKKAIAPELFPRSLYWFRWGALYTWATGVFMLLTVFYMGGLMFDSEGAWEGGWGAPSYVALAIVFFGFFVYDWLYSGPLAKNDIVATAISVVLIAGVLWLFEAWAGWTYRAYTIHLGAMFGTFMMMNVWMRIWPAQQKIIPAVKAGEAPDGALAAMAGMRSKHNTYMSVPLVWTMLNAHSTTIGPSNPMGPSSFYVLLPVVIVGWYLTSLLYKKSQSVGGM